MKLQTSSASLRCHNYKIRVWYPSRATSHNSSTRSLYCVLPPAMITARVTLMLLALFAFVLAIFVSLVLSNVIKIVWYGPRTRRCVKSP
jgi:hypothetical protein